MSAATKSNRTAIALCLFSRPHCVLFRRFLPSAPSRRQLTRSTTIVGVLCLTLPRRQRAPFSWSPKANAASMVHRPADPPPPPWLRRRPRGRGYLPPSSRSFSCAVIRLFRSRWKVLRHWRWNWRGVSWRHYFGWDGSANELLSSHHDLPLPAKEAPPPPPPTRTTHAFMRITTTTTSTTLYRRRNPGTWTRRSLRLVKASHRRTFGHRLLAGLLVLAFLMPLVSQLLVGCGTGGEPPASAATKQKVPSVFHLLRKRTGDLSYGSL